MLRAGGSAVFKGERNRPLNLKGLTCPCLIPAAPHCGMVQEVRLIPASDLDVDRPSRQ